MIGVRLLAAALATCLGMACAGSIRPSISGQPQAADALLVLPGFGYGGSAERAIRAAAPAIRAAGFDLYVPDYVARAGLAESRATLRRFVAAERLDRYERVHVFAFLAGAWTINPLLEDAAFLPNLKTIVYDRSPYQERAPRIAYDRLRFLTRLRHGGVVFELARQPYRPLPRGAVDVGLMIETVPTGLVKRYASTALSYGPVRFECEAMAQPFDDCMFVQLDHGQMYTRFIELWPEILSFARHRRFTPAAGRTPPAADALTAHVRRKEGA